MKQYDMASNYFNELGAYHVFLKEKYLCELKSLPAGTLSICSYGKPDGAVRYYRYLNGKRTGITKNPTLVQSLARKKYIETALPMVEKNMLCLQKLMKQYEDIGLPNVTAKLRPKYAELFCESTKEWNDKKCRWSAEPYEYSRYKVEKKEHTTAKGLKVRSKSEVIIAERLDFYGVPYRYEELIHIDRYSFAPDFTVLTRDGLKWWEHCGKVNDPAYVDKHNWKIHMYSKQGIVPWKNLIVTYDDENGNLDARVIEAEILNKIL